jgi:hypothetical protein
VHDREREYRRDDVADSRHEAENRVEPDAAVRAGDPDRLVEEVREADQRQEIGGERLGHLAIIGSKIAAFSSDGAPSRAGIHSRRVRPMSAQNLASSAPVQRRQPVVEAPDFTRVMVKKRSKVLLYVAAVGVAVVALVFMLLQLV